MPPFDPTQSGSLLWLAALLDATAKGLAILIAASAATWLLRRRSAALRHLVWTLSVIGLMVVPVLSVALPQWQVPILPGWAGPKVPLYAPPPAPAEPAPPDWPMGVAGTSAPFAIPRAGPMTDIAPEPAAPAGPAAPVQPPAPAPIHWSTWALLAWLVGAAAMAIPLAIGTVTVWRQVRQARPMTDADWLALLARLRQTLGVRRDVRILRSGRSNIPLTCGTLRPAILLPAEADDWSADRRRVVLLHELAHVKRADCLTQMIARLARVLYWFNPLVWLAGRMLRVEREQACDDLVLAAGHKASDYASHLLEIVRTLRSQRCPSLAAVAMARRSQFEGRMLAILDPRRNRRALTRWGAVAAALLVAGIVVPLACLKATGVNPASAPESPAAEKPDAAKADWGEVVEGQVELSKPLSINAKVIVPRPQFLTELENTTIHPDMRDLPRPNEKPWVGLSVTSIQFMKEAGRLKARLNAGCLLANYQYSVEVQLIEKDGKIILGKKLPVEDPFSTMVYSLFWGTKELVFDLGPWDELSAASRFRVVLSARAAAQQAAKGPFTLDLDSETMSNATALLWQKYPRRLCFENLDFDKEKDAITIERAIAEFEAAAKTRALTPNEARRIELARDLLRQGNPGKMLFDVGAYYSGHFEGATFDELLENLTQGTPYAWRKFQDTYIIYPAQGSLLGFKVNLDTEGLTVDQAAHKILDQQPRIAMESTWALPVRPGEDPTPWLHVKLPGMRLANLSAADALCAVTEAARPDSVWALGGYKGSRGLNLLRGPNKAAPPPAATPPAALAAESIGFGEELDWEAYFRRITGTETPQDREKRAAREKQAFEDAIRKMAPDTSTVPATHQPATRLAVDAAEIARLIGQLGSQKSAEREDAQKSLVKIGLPAVAALQQAASDKDAERSHHAQTALNEIDDKAFGGQADGFQIRLRPLLSRWKTGQTVRFQLQLCNRGQKEILCPGFKTPAADCRIELDGQWYWWSLPVELNVLVSTLKPGQVLGLGVDLVESWVAMEEGKSPSDCHKKLILAPGAHVVRVSYGDTISNPVHLEFQADPATPPAAQAVGERVVSADTLSDGDLGKICIVTSPFRGMGGGPIPPPGMVTIEGDQQHVRGRLSAVTKDEVVLDFPPPATYGKMHIPRKAIVSVAFMTEAPPRPPATRLAVDAAEIARLIGQLGSQKSAEREDAQKVLVKIGLPAVAALQEAASDKDAERSRHAQTALNEIDDKAFGGQADGFQIRLRPLLSRWKTGQTVSLQLQLCNRGQKEIGCPGFRTPAADCRIELDGQWYWWSLPVVINVPDTLLKPGQVEVIGVELVESWVAVEAGKSPSDCRKKLSMAPGAHVVRVSYGDTISNPVHLEFQADPATPPAAQPAAPVKPDDELKALRQLLTRPAEYGLPKESLPAVERLVEIGSAEAVQILYESLSHPLVSRKIKLHALPALGRIGSKEALKAYVDYQAWAAKFPPYPPFLFRPHESPMDHFADQDVAPLVKWSAGSGQTQREFAAFRWHRYGETRLWLVSRKPLCPWFTPGLLAMSAGDAGRIGKAEHLTGVYDAGRLALKGDQIDLTLEPQTEADDVDKDDVPDALEVMLGTDPNKTDTDGDGIADGRDSNPQTPKPARVSEEMDIRQAAFLALFGTSSTRDAANIAWDAGANRPAEIPEWARQEYYGMGGYVLRSQRIRQGWVNITGIDIKRKSATEALVSIHDYEGNAAASTHEIVVKRLGRLWVPVSVRMTVIS